MGRVSPRPVFAVLLGAGTKGRRFALPQSRIMIHQPLIHGDGIGGQATDIEVEAREFQDRTGLQCTWTLPEAPLGVTPKRLPQARI